MYVGVLVLGDSAWTTVWSQWSCTRMARWWRAEAQLTHVVVERRVGGHEAVLVCPERVDEEAPARRSGEDERLVEGGRRCELVELLTCTKSQTEKSLWKQTSWVMCVWRRAGCVASVEGSRRSPH